MFFFLLLKAGGLVWSPYNAEDTMDSFYPDLAQVSFITTVYPFIYIYCRLVERYISAESDIALVSWVPTKLAALGISTRIVTSIQENM